MLLVLGNILNITLGKVRFYIKIVCSYTEASKFFRVSNVYTQKD